MVVTGIKGHQETVVTPSNSATGIGSGLVQVFATAMMIALMEKAATLSIQPFLDEGQGSVGIHVNVSHCSASPLGMRVWVDTEVIEIDRRKITFSVKAYDEHGLIGEGTHDRFLIDKAKFMEKTLNKVKNQPSCPTR